MEMRFSISFFLSALTLVGCASTEEPPGNRACVQQILTPVAGSRCIGLKDVSYSYVNGVLPTNPPASEADFYEIHNDKVRDYYYKQQSKNSCYAAALRTAFAYHGVHYDEVNFISAISDECTGAGFLPLTISQIVFSATRVHLKSGGIWFADDPQGSQSAFLNSVLSSQSIDGETLSKKPTFRSTFFRKLQVCRTPEGGVSFSSAIVSADFTTPLLRAIGLRPIAAASHSTVPFFQPYFPAENPIDAAYTQEQLQDLSAVNPYASITWHTQGNPPEMQGGISPIAHSGDLVWQFFRGAPVLLGLKGDSFGHVVVVTKIRYLGTAPQNNLSIAPRTYIDWVEVMDPSAGEHSIYRISGNEVLEQAQFIFAIYHPVQR